MRSASPCLRTQGMMLTTLTSRAALPCFCGTAEGRLQGAGADGGGVGASGSLAAARQQLPAASAHAACAPAGRQAQPPPGSHSSRAAQPQQASNSHPLLSGCSAPAAQQPARPPHLCKVGLQHRAHHHVRRLAGGHVRDDLGRARLHEPDPALAAGRRGWEGRRVTGGRCGEQTASAPAGPPADAPASVPGASRPRAAGRPARHPRARRTGQQEVNMGRGAVSVRLLTRPSRRSSSSNPSSMIVRSAPASVSAGGHRQAGGQHAAPQRQRQQQQLGGAARIAGGTAAAAAVAPVPSHRQPRAPAHQTRSQSPGASARRPARRAASGTSLHGVPANRRRGTAGGSHTQALPAGRAAAATRPTTRQACMAASYRGRAHHLAGGVDAHAQTQLFSKGDAHSGRGLRDAQFLLLSQLLLDQRHVVHLLGLPGGSCGCKRRAERWVGGMSRGRRAHACGSIRRKSAAARARAGQHLACRGGGGRAARP